MNDLKLNHSFKVLIIGSSGAIGRAFVQAFDSDVFCAHIEKISRSDTPGFDLMRPDSISRQAEISAPAGPFNMVIDATGALVIDQKGPEKSLIAIDDTHLTKSFQINTIGPALVLRHFTPLLASGPSIYAKLSARVGSISDNRKGGWYSYRASKAAFNMILQTAALELQRKNPALRVVALQPGTVRSKLSQPFTGLHTQLLDPAESVAGMLRVLKGLQPRVGAHFIDHKGHEIAW